MEIFRLFGSILVNSDQADQSLQRTDEHAERVGGTLMKGIGTAAKWGVGIVAAAGSGAIALFGMASKASEAAANIDDVSQRTNLSAKTLQEFKYAAEMSGFSMDTIESSAKKLTKTMGAYADGNKGTIADFEQLGLSATGANGKLKSTDELFPQIIAKLANMKDITERNTLAMSIFGKGAMDMAPLLNGGSEGVKALTDEAHKLGLVMSDESVSAGALFDDTLTQVKSSLGALITKIGLEALPIAQQMLQWVTDHMPQIQSIATTVFDNISKAISFVKDNSNWLIPVLSGLVSAFVALEIISVISGLMTAYTAFTTTATGVQIGLNAALMANPIGLVVAAMATLVAAGILLYQNWDVVKAKATEIFGAIGSFIGGIIDGIKSGFRGMVNGVITGLNFMINALNKLKFNVPDWIPVIGGSNFGFNLDNIPSFAVGTRYLPQDMLIQAHKGEMIVPADENPYSNSGNGKTMPSGGITQNVNIYSPIALSPSETARQNKRALQELVLQL